MEEETQRGHKHQPSDKRKAIEQNGGDELAAAQRASHAPAEEDSKSKLGVNEEHKTKKMQDEHRGTFP